jgi:hypothetical protein
MYVFPLFRLSVDRSQDTFRPVNEVGKWPPTRMEVKNNSRKWLGIGEKYSELNTQVDRFQEQHRPPSFLEASTRMEIQHRPTVGIFGPPQEIL